MNEYNVLLAHLETAAALIESGAVHYGLDLAFEKLDEALRERRFARVDYAVRDFNFLEAPIDLCVLILMSIKPCSDITHRADAVRGLKHRLEVETDENTARKIWRWL